MSPSSKFGRKPMGRTLPPICKKPPRPPVPILPWPPPYILCSASTSYRPPWQPGHSIVGFQRLQRLLGTNEYHGRIVRPAQSLTIAVRLTIDPPTADIKLTHWIGGFISPLPYTGTYTPIATNPFSFETNNWEGVFPVYSQAYILLAA
jgi:hypothetical protein